MVYNLRSIGMSLMENAGQRVCLLKPAQEGKKSLAGSSNTASASSLNIPSKNETSPPANQNAAYISYSHQNTNQNHATDTYVSLMSTFEESKTSKSKYKRRKGTNQAETMELHDMSLINLDSSLDSSLDVTVPENSSMNVVALDTSNNSTPHTSSSSIASPSAENNKKIVCSILNCAAEFSSRMNLENHTELFKHSPCNPCLLARDCKLSHIPIFYMCPDCDIEFSTRDECTEHMNKKNHLPFYPPLAITAYMCAQCLHLFGSFEACWTHIEHSSHHGMSYPFANDYTTGNQMNVPIAVTEELVQNIISKCSKVVYTVQCLECGMLMETPAILKHHMRETQNQHVVAALTDTSLVEVFASYLAGYSCNSCHRLFTGELKELAKHQCARRVVGTLVENDTRSFAEFVKRCALTVTKSLERENMPGPSRNARSSPHCERRNKRAEYMGAAVANTSDNGTGQGSEKSEHAVYVNLDDTGEVGASAENASGSIQRSSEKVRKSSNTSEASFHDSLKKKLQKKNEKVENDNTEGNFIVIDDTDDGSDETDVDFTSASGAKRKRKTKSSSENKHKPSKKYDSTPTMSDASSSTHSEAKRNSNQLLESPFFVMNYKPHSSRLGGNVLTQGYAVQPSETRLSPIKALDGGSKQAQPENGTPSRYMLRSRGTDQAAHNSGTDSDAGFGNIAQRFLQEATRNTGSSPEEQADEVQTCKRDRPRSPLQLIDPAPNFYRANVLTQGHVGQPYLLPVTAIEEFNIRTRQLGQSAMPYQSHYQLRNQGNPMGAAHRLQTPLPPPSLFPHQAAQQIMNPQAGHQVSRNSQSVSLAENTRPNSCNVNISSGLPQTSNATTSNVSQAYNQRKPFGKALISPEHLTQMKNIVFLDLDNWPGFFSKLPRCLPDFTFVWGFFGGKNVWFEPSRQEIFRQMKQKGFFYLNERCGTTKDAADFAIVLAVGKMDEKLPTNIAFTIMSGDKGFCEVERQMRNSERKVMVVNPHTAAQFSNDMVYALVTSVTDT